MGTACDGTDESVPFPKSTAFVRSLSSLGLRPKGQTRPLSVPHSSSSSPPIRPSEAPSCSLLHHHGVNVSLRAQLGIDVVAVGAELFGYIKDQCSGLDIDFVRQELLVDARKLDRIAQRHLAVDDVYDHLEYRIGNRCRSRRAERKPRRAVRMKHDRRSHRRNWTFARSQLA